MINLKREWDYSAVINKNAQQIRVALLNSALNIYMGRKPNKNDLKQVGLIMVPPDPEKTEALRTYVLKLGEKPIGTLREWFEGTVYKANFEEIEGRKEGILNIE